ncbi:MAG: phosphate acetyltransferase [Bacteroidales bacterium]|nr:phosphate acetyltransferase [Bacteroidales bacterium]
MLFAHLKERAKANPQRIVLPEGEDPRILTAVDMIEAEEVAHVILLGNRARIEQKIRLLELTHLTNVTIIDPSNAPQHEAYTDAFYTMRRRRGCSHEMADELMRSPLYFGCMMVRQGDADAMLGGASNTTADVLKAAHQIIRTRRGISVVSGVMLIDHLPKHYGYDGGLCFADIAVQPDPNADELAQIALCTAETVEDLVGIEPRIAMISFSTLGSSQHPCVEKVVEAVHIAKEKRPELLIDGELQIDAAIEPLVAHRKAPQSEVAGRANTLIFPNLDAGNSAYKLTQRLAHGRALGPILQGLNAPVNDLSRGCSYSDVYNMIIITVVQAIAKKEGKRICNMK